MKFGIAVIAVCLSFLIGFEAGRITQRNDLMKPCFNDCGLSCFTDACRLFMNNTNKGE